MIETSQEYKNLMLSNVRPKCEPRITVEGIDNNGNKVKLVWNAQNIASFNYKRGVDPIGRELPYMTLEWTEIYYGKLNEQNYPEKYNNIVKYMLVTVEFRQDLGFSSIWRNCLSLTWGEIKNKKWRDLTTEVVTPPKLYLSARPTIDGHTIKWTAVDLLSLLDENVIKDFGNPNQLIAIQNPILYFLINERGRYRQAKYVFEALTSTINYIKNIPDEFWDRWNGASSMPVEKIGKLDKRVIFNTTVKDGIKNYLAAFSYYLDFYENKIIILSAGNWSNHPDIMWELPANVLYDYPEVSRGVNISAYNFKNYTATEMPGKSFEMTSNEAEPFVMFNHTFYKYYFGGYGTVTGGTNGTTEDITFAIASSPADIDVTPIELVATENTIINSEIGECFAEDNPVNPFANDSLWVSSRFDMLCDYFQEDANSFNIKTIGNPALEPGDVIQVATNLYNGNTQTSKTAIVVGLEIEYNGTIKEKIKAHEVFI